MSNPVSKLSKLTEKSPTNSASKVLETLKKKETKNKDDLVFSFMFFDRQHKYFNLGGTPDNWFLDLIDVLSNLSKVSWNEIYNNLRSTYDPHDYSGNPTVNISEQLSSEFGNKYNEMKQLDFCQLRIGSASDGRLHGFIISNIYYIIWLDPKHNMYNSEGYERSKKYKPMKSELEIAKEEADESQKNYKIIENLFEDECGKLCPHLILSNKS